MRFFKVLRTSGLALLAALTLGGGRPAQADDLFDLLYGDNGIYSDNAINFLFNFDQGYQWQTPVPGYEELEYNRRYLDTLYNPDYGIYGESSIKLMFGGLGGD